VLGPDIPTGATTFGYGSNDGFNNQKSAFSSFNTVAVGQGTTATTLHGPVAPIQVNGNIDSLISVARGEVGVSETSENQGAGIQKYWSACDYSSGYNDRAPWCAAFTTWCIRQSGLFSEADRPKSASAFKGGGYEAWARSKAPKVSLRFNPTSINKGDIVIQAISHIVIATTASDLNGDFRSIGGNSGNAVREKTNHLCDVRSAITIGQ
jgi:hypothetical protein